MNAIGVAGVCIIAVILCKMIEKYNKEYAVFIVLGISIICFLFTISYISPIVEGINSMFSETGLSKEYIEILFKSLGICYITDMGCDICRDNGENAIAVQVEFAGKVALLLIAFPLFESLIEIIGSILR